MYMQIMAVPPGALTTHMAGQAKEGAKKLYPPTMFVHMPRDSHTAQFVKRDMEVLQGKV